MSARETLHSDLLTTPTAATLPHPEGWASARIQRFRDEVRAETLAEAKAEVIAWLAKKAREDTPVTRLADKVDRGAIRLFLEAEEKASAPAPTATPKPTQSGEWAPAAALRDRLADLLAHIRKHPGRTWTTEDVRKFYLSQAPKRATCRRDLTALRAMGWLTEHDEPGRRFFTLTPRKDGQR